MPLAVLATICLVGCSSGSSDNVLATIGGVVYNNDVPTNVTKHMGSTAEQAISGYDDTIIKYCTHTSFGDCSNNERGVAEVNTNDVGDGIKWYSSYLGSHVTAHDYSNKDYLVCAGLRHTEPNIDSVALPLMQSTLKSVDLTSVYNVARLDDVLEVRNFMSIAVKPNEIVIPEVMMIGYDTNNVLKTDGSAMIGEKTVGTFTDGQFDYYKLNNVYIKAQKGVDVSYYVTFLN